MCLTERYCCTEATPSVVKLVKVCCKSGGMYVEQCTLCAGCGVSNSVAAAVRLQVLQYACYYTTKVFALLV
jgi:hypothetical protein